MADKASDLMTGAAGPRPGEGVVLPTEADVIEACKQEGARLAVSEVAEGCFALEGGGIESKDEKLGPLVRLWTAFTRHDITYLTPDAEGISSMKSMWLVPKEVHSTLNSRLSDESSDVRRLSTLPITRCFVYVDVSDFSQHRPGQQALIIASLVSMVRNRRYWNCGFALFALQDVEAMLCIGDGYIFVLKDVTCAAYFAAHLAQLIETQVARKAVPVEFHFRMGVHVGPVYCFWDWGRGGRKGPGAAPDQGGEPRRPELGDWNYIGEGINGGQRVLAAVGKDTDDVLFVSGQVRQALAAQDDGTEPRRAILKQLQNRGRRADKHGKHWRVYEVPHTSLCASGVASALGLGL